MGPVGHVADTSFRTAKSRECLTSWISALTTVEAFWPSVPNAQDTVGRERKSVGFQLGTAGLRSAVCHWAALH